MTTFCANLVQEEELRGPVRNFQVRGGILFSEWDADDRRHYYWEEWELVGPGVMDNWIEYDHYTNQLCLYEPVSFVEPIEPDRLREGSRMTLTDEAGNVNHIIVDEVGKGTVIRLAGWNAKEVEQGDEMVYATMRCMVGGRQTELTFERYNGREYSVYRKTVLSFPEQTQLFGKVVAPSGKPRFKFQPNLPWIIAIAVVIIGVAFMVYGCASHSAKGGFVTGAGGVEMALGDIVSLSLWAPMLVRHCV